MSLTIYENTFNREKQKAKESAEEIYGDEREDELNFDGTQLVPDEIEFDTENEKIKVFGDIKTSKREDIAWVDLELNISLEIMIDIIEHCMKKLGRLKTVMEATK